MNAEKKNHGLKDVIYLKSFEFSQMPQNYLEEYFTHFICRTGFGKFELENKNYSINKGDMVIWMPPSSVKNIMFSPDFDADIFLISHELLNQYNPNIGWGIQGFFFSKSNPVISLSEKDKSSILNNFKNLYDIFSDFHNRFYEEILSRQTEIFLMNMWNIFTEEFEKRTESLSRMSHFERFLTLIEEHCISNREVNFYSDLMCISPKYLGELCKMNSGKTAMEWINNFTSRRISLLLKNKNLSIAEISEAMNFSSTSFFSRYVKKNLGCSPSEFRKISL